MEIHLLGSYSEVYVVKCSDKIKIIYSVNVALNKSSFTGLQYEGSSSEERTDSDNRRDHSLTSKKL